jgi:beta-glucosidase
MEENMKHSLGKHMSNPVVVIAILSVVGGCAPQAAPRTAAAPAASTPPAVQTPAQGGSTSAGELGIYKNGDNVAPYALFLGSPSNWYEAIPKDKALSHPTIKVEPGQVNVPGDAKKITWTGNGQMYANAKATDRLAFLNADAALVFDTVIHEAPKARVEMRVDCKYPCVGFVDADAFIKTLGIEKKSTIKIPLSCFAAAGTDFGKVDSVFLIFTSGRFSASIANIRWVPGAAKDADAMKCKTK